MNKYSLLILAFAPFCISDSDGLVKSKAETECEKAIGSCDKQLNIDFENMTNSFKADEYCAMRQKHISCLKKINASICTPGFEDREEEAAGYICSSACQTTLSRLNGKKAGQLCSFFNPFVAAMKECGGYKGLNKSFLDSVECKKDGSNGTAKTSLGFATFVISFGLMKILYF